MGTRPLPFSIGDRAPGFVGASASGRFAAIHERCVFGSVAEHLADRFGTQGSPDIVNTLGDIVLRDEQIRP